MRTSKWGSRRRWLVHPSIVVLRAQFIYWAISLPRIDRKTNVCLARNALRPTHRASLLPNPDSDSNRDPYCGGAVFPIHHGVAFLVSSFSALIVQDRQTNASHRTANCTDSLFSNLIYSALLYEQTRLQLTVSQLHVLTAELAAGNCAVCLVGVDQALCAERRRPAEQTAQKTAITAS